MVTFTPWSLFVPSLWISAALRARAVPLSAPEPAITAHGQEGEALHEFHNFTFRAAVPDESGSTTAQLVKRFDDARFSLYDPGLGACGGVNSDSDFIVALNSAQWANGAHCNARITISYNGKSTQAQIVDQCPGCPYGGLDLSRGLFSYFAPQSVGIIYGTWNFVGSGGNAAAAALPQSTSTSSSYTAPRPTPTPKPTPAPVPTPTTTPTLTTTPTPTPTLAPIASPSSETSTTTEASVSAPLAAPPAPVAAAAAAAMPGFPSPLASSASSNANPLFVVRQLITALWLFGALIAEGLGIDQAGSS